MLLYFVSVCVRCICGSWTQATICFERRKNFFFPHVKRICWMTVKPIRPLWRKTVPSNRVPLAVPQPNSSEIKLFSNIWVKGGGRKTDEEERRENEIFEAEELNRDVSDKELSMVGKKTLYIFSERNFKRRLNSLNCTFTHRLWCFRKWGHISEFIFIHSFALWVLCSSSYSTVCSTVCTMRPCIVINVIFVFRLFCKRVVETL